MHAVIKYIHAPIAIHTMYTYIVCMQAIVGDQLTCKTIRGAKRWRLPEVEPKDQLTWAHEIPGECILFTETHGCMNTHLCTCTCTDTYSHETSSLQAISIFFGNVLREFFAYSGAHPAKLALFVM